MRVVVHVTHEAVHKIGGIGAVLEGLLTSKAYTKAIDRTILVSPLFSTDGSVEQRLGPTGEVLYSSVDGLIKSQWAAKFRKVEKDYNVGIVYGRRTLRDPHSGVRLSPEVLLIDVTRVDEKQVNAFKAKLWETFGIESNRYESMWDYEQYVNLAPPALAALEALGAAKASDQCVVVAHEFMGMPTALAAILSGKDNYRTLFYAHEVATVRKIVEDHPGHDTMFYNMLRVADRDQLYLEDIFGPQDHFFKHALVCASKYCDNIMAVGDYVIKELRFLGPEFHHVDIDLCYNGIPAAEISVEQKLHSKSKLQRYAEILLDFRPDYIFTHVTRTAVSKGLWRDIRVLEHIEKAFRQQNKTAVMFMLSTELPSRRLEDILHMEKWWKWPVAHHEGLPDLSGGEAAIYTGVQEFNAKGRNVKLLYINQFGFSPDTCGMRMPADMEFMDIRRGTDIEFGQSIYEPFGISPLEPLTFGALCVISNVSGCAGFVQAVCEDELPPNVIIADYTDLDEPGLEVDDLLALDQAKRDQVEGRVARRVAEKILRRLPKDNQELAERIKLGYSVAHQMNWEKVAEDYFLRAVERACRKRRVLQVA